MEDQPRTKEEIIREIEASRRNVNAVVHEKKAAMHQRKEAFDGWKTKVLRIAKIVAAVRGAVAQTQLTVLRTRVRVTHAATATDNAIRANVYKAVGLALFAGTVTGFLVSRRRSALRRAEMPF